MKTFKQYLAEKHNQPESLTYTHYSHSADLKTLSGSKSGTGIRGREEERLKGSPDKRIQSRVYFYPPSPGGELPRPEANLGHHVYQTKLTNMHDATKQSPESLKIAAKAKEHVAAGDHPSNAYERAVLDSGYHGYHTHDMSVVLGKDVPVEYKGTHHGKTFGSTPRVDTKEKSKSILDSPQNSEGEHSSSSLSNEQAMFFMKNKNTLQKAAPSLRMQYGKLYVHHNDINNFNDELSKNHQNHPL